MTARLMAFTPLGFEIGGTVWCNRLTQFLIVCVMATLLGVSACSDVNAPLATPTSPHIGAPMREFGDCLNSSNPGGWCDDEYNAILDAIYAISGDESCMMMRNVLLTWIYQTANGGYVLSKQPDYSPSLGAATVRNDHAEFSDRWNGTGMNPTVVSGYYHDHEGGLTLGQTLRHEYGHIFLNTHDDPTVDAYFDDSCGLGGAHNGGGLGDPAPPVI